MTKKRGNPINADYLLQGSPTNSVYAEPFPRYLASANTSALTTQVMTSVAVPLQAGDIVTNITFKSATTAAGTPTNWWFALYNPSGTLLAQTADQTSGAWAANTTKTLALTTAQLISTPGVYYAAVMVKATTPPTLAGLTLHHADLSTGLLTTEKVLAQTSGSSLTTTAPSTIATPTAITAVPYCVLT
jgi:hypothetical protein